MNMVIERFAEPEFALGHFFCLLFSIVRVFEGFHTLKSGSACAVVFYRRRITLPGSFTCRVASGRRVLSTRPDNYFGPAVPATGYTQAEPVWDQDRSMSKSIRQPPEK